eukprot:687516-Amorphochlora_amoeboformis.AAC.1
MDLCISIVPLCMCLLWSPERRRSVYVTADAWVHWVVAQLLSSKASHVYLGKIDLTQTHEESRFRSRSSTGDSQGLPGIKFTLTFQLNLQGEIT